MSSKNSANRLVLEQGLPVTREDIEASRQPVTAMSTEAYWRWLSTLPEPSSEELKRRTIPHGSPFKLR